MKVKGRKNGVIITTNDRLSQTGLREHQCGNTIELRLTIFLDKSTDVRDSFRIYGHLLVIYGHCTKISNKGALRRMNGDSERLGGAIHEINRCPVEMS